MQILLQLQLKQIVVHGNSATATKLQTKRNIGITGAVTGTATGFDGTGNINIPTTLLNPDYLNKVVPISKGGTGTTTGNVPTATKLQTARTITLSGTVKGSASFDGTKNVTINTTQGNKVLYDNASGTTGTITLSESSANFHYLEFFFAWGAEKSVKVSQPNGKAIELQTGLWNNNTTIQKFKRMKISGTTISIVNDYVGSLNTWNNSMSTENVIRVYKIVGYK